MKRSGPARRESGKRQRGDDELANWKRWVRPLACFTTLVFIGLACESPVEAPTTGRIEGTVTELGAGTRLGDVTVTTTPTTGTARTDSNGRYVFESISPGTYTLGAFRAAFLPAEVSVTVKAGQTSYGDLALVLATPVAELSSSLLNFGTSSTSSTFWVSNGGGGSLNWSILVTEPWLKVSPDRGTTTTEEDVVTVTVDRSLLAAGNYQSTLTLSSNANVVEIPVLVTEPSSTAPQLTVFPLSFDLGPDQGRGVAYIQNTGTATVQWRIEGAEPWLQVDPAMGVVSTETDTIFLTVDRTGLVPGAFACYPTVNSDAGTALLSVRMEVASEPMLEIVPAELSFGEDDETQIVDVQNIGSGELEWEASPSEPWLAVSPGSGSGGQALEISVDRGGMSAGAHLGGVSFRSNGGDRELSVTLVVAGSDFPDPVVINEPAVVWFDSVGVDWTTSSSPEFKAYELYRDTSPGVNDRSPRVLRETSRYATSFTDQDIEPGATYYYRVYVVNTADRASGSNVVEVKTQILGRWAYMGVSAGARDLFDVCALDDNTAYAVGDSGSILMWDGVNWARFDSPTTDALYAVSISRDDQVFIGGEAGLFQLANGVWRAMAGAPEGVVNRISSQDGLLVVSMMSGSEIGLWQNDVWRAFDLDGDFILDVEVLGDNLALAYVGRPDRIYRFDGFGWSVLSDISGYLYSSQSYGMRAFAEDNIWVAEQENRYGNRRLSHWDGRSWRSVTGSAVSPYGPGDVDGYSPAAVWTADTDGDFWLLQQSEWLKVESSGEANINKFHMYSATAGWAVGDDGGIHRYH